VASAEPPPPGGGGGPRGPSKGLSKGLYKGAPEGGVYLPCETAADRARRSAPGSPDLAAVGPL
jgi:hypothetical protein